MEKLWEAVQTHLSEFIAVATHHGFLNNKQLVGATSSSHESRSSPLFSLSHSSSPNSPNTDVTTTSSSIPLHRNPDNDFLLERNKANPVSKEELGRATWTFLHTLGAQYPDKPTRQQRRDAKELMEILSRMYPCKDCADHFKEILRSNPVQAGSQTEFSQWLCHVHNIVNRSLGKVAFQCERVDARWGKLECEQRACDLQGASTTTGFGRDMP